MEVRFFSESVFCIFIIQLGCLVSFQLQYLNHATVTQSIILLIRVQPVFQQIYYCVEK